MDQEHSVLPLPSTREEGREQVQLEEVQLVGAMTVAAYLRAQVLVQCSVAVTLA